MNDEYVFDIKLDIRALRLEYKTTCDALRVWPGGDRSEQDYLVWKKGELFKALLEIEYHLGDGGL